MEQQRGRTNRRRFLLIAGLPLPAPLKPYLPAAEARQHSPECDVYADREGSGPDVSISAGRYLFDTARDLVHFDVLYLSG